MSKIIEIQGLWRVVEYEEDGIRRPESGVQSMARLLFLPNSVGAEHDGIWGGVAYAAPPSHETLILSIRSLISLFEGQPYQWSDQFHIYTGGRVFLALTTTSIWLCYTALIIIQLLVQNLSVVASTDKTEMFFICVYLIRIRRNVQPPFHRLKRYTNL
jgi:hypothetical protein